MGHYIKKFQEIHGDNYNLENIIAQDIKLPLKAKDYIFPICKIHGEFRIRVDTFAFGQGCPKCSSENRTKNIDTGLKDKIKKLKETNNFGFGKITKENFFQIAAIFHDNKYDYSNSIYVNMHTEFEFICPIHGVIRQLPGNHLKTNGCSKCGGRAKLVYSDIIKRAHEIHDAKRIENDLPLYEYGPEKEISGNTDLLDVYCPIHGWFKQQIANHLNGRGCSKCAMEIVGNSKRDTKETFVNKSKILFGEKEFIYDKVVYVDSKTLVNLTHSKCGRSFWKEPNHHLSGQGCPFCNTAPKSTSSYENEIYDFLKLHLPNTEILTNCRILSKNRELDIYIPSLNLAIEIDGIYWHNEIVLSNSGKNPKTYHLEKTKECLSKNIRLIHIFESELIESPNIIKSRLLNIIGKTPNIIYGRNTVIKELTTIESTKFFDDNHLQHSVRGGIYYYGLYTNDNELVSAMIIGKRNIGRSYADNEFELLRFANKLNTNVIGGASKLLKHILNKHKNIDTLYSDCDLRWSTGNVYNKLGFTKMHISEPNYWYVDGLVLKHRFTFNKQKLIEKYECPKEFTEHQFMLNVMKIPRIYDCGNIVFRWDRIYDL